MLFALPTLRDSSDPLHDPDAAMPLPNKRLKLAGGDRFRGIGVLCAGGHNLSFNDGCAGGRVARSLSAIR